MRKLKAEHLEALRANVRTRASTEARHQAGARQGIKTSSSVRDFALSRWKAWNHLPARLEVLSASPEPEESGQRSISRVSPFLAWGVKWECPATASLPSERWDGADFRSSNASWIWVRFLLKKLQADKGWIIQMEIQDTFPSFGCRYGNN